MSGLPKVPSIPRTCQFCGVATLVAHETQEGCIAALHIEIGRMRGILANLKPVGVHSRTEAADDPAAATIRLTRE